MGLDYKSRLSEVSSYVPRAKIPGSLCSSLGCFVEKERRMSPKVLEEGELIFWFHSHDALYENQASLHVGKGSQDDYNDAKIWLEPEIEIARPGRILRSHELNRALKVIEQNHNYLLEQWDEFKGRTS
ncbi:MAG TPA: DUF4160 domain-containing protein [Anaerolineae bacterium]|nr:DUF4160 domain-containing protein [Anaerolineae bacterium]